MKYAIFVFLCALVIPLWAADYNIIDFGAVPNNGIVCTKAIQSAIDQCSLKGGGRVIIPAGEFLSGTLLLKDHVNLHLESGALLKGSASLADYTHNERVYGLIRAWQAVHIAITGLGTIDGSGTPFFQADIPHVGADFDRSYIRQGRNYMTFESGIGDGPIAYESRPDMMVVLLRCETVTIRDVTFRDSPSWTFRIADCDDVLLHGIRIKNNLLVPNSDGIHCTTSRNVRISNCDIRAGDDAIIVTGFGDEINVHGNDSLSNAQYSKRTVGNRTGYAENIVVTNCTLLSRSSGIRVGYGANSIRHCTFSNIVITDSNRGIGVFARDEGSICDIQFSNITIQTRLFTGHWWGNGEPIHISAIARDKAVPVGSIQRVKFDNIIAESGSGIVIYGEKPQIIRDVTLEDVHLAIKRGEHTLTYGGNFDLRPTADLKDAVFQHDIAGLFARHVEHLDIDGLQLIWDEALPSFYSHGLELEKVIGGRINNYTGSPAPKSKKGETIHMQDCRDISAQP